MSGSTITQAFVQQWDTSLRHELGQKDSRFMKAVTDRGTITGESFTINNLDDDGSLMPVNSVRHGDTQWSNDTYVTAVVTMKDFYDAKPLDRNDIPKMIVNPVTGGDYMAKIIAKRNRTIDNLIYRACRDSQLKKDGTSEALPSGQKIAHGSAGFTKGKPRKSSAPTSATNTTARSCTSPTAPTCWRTSSTTRRSRAPTSWP